MFLPRVSHLVMLGHYGEFDVYSCAGYALDRLKGASEKTYFHKKVQRLIQVEAVDDWRCLNERDHFVNHCCW